MASLQLPTPKKQKDCLTFTRPVVYTKSDMRSIFNYIWVPKKKCVYCIWSPMSETNSGQHRCILSIAVV